MRFRKLFKRFDTEGVKPKERPCSPTSIIVDQLMFQKLLQILQSEQKCVRPKKVATFNTFLRKLKLRNVMMFNHFWKCYVY